jgi:hypothetical protein
MTALGMPQTDQNGNRYWYNSEGELHCELGPAIEYADGSRLWFLNGQLHRLDGPAVEWADGYRAWYLNDRQHREDGPAIEWEDGDREWWLNGKCLTFAEWQAICH